MHEIKIRVLPKVYKQVFKQLYSIIISRLVKIRVNLPHKETIQRQQAGSHEIRYKIT
jgi:hypothetical protein